METVSTLLALWAMNSTVTCEFPSQRSVTWSFEIFIDLRLNKRLNKQLRRRWFATPSRSQCHCNDAEMDLQNDQKAMAYEKFLPPTEQIVPDK